jgi:tripartite-type tricarboxylate transporter receptor subunit TctC
MGLLSMIFKSLLAGATAAVALLTASGAVAQTPAEFFKGKTIELYIAYSAGGGYDLYARMVARHIGKHIPGNPQVVAKNMEGAGGLRLANWLYQAAPQDGTVIGATSRNIAFEPLIGNKAAQYDSSQFTWLGSANDEVSTCVSWHTSGVVTIDDAVKRELIIGAIGTADDTYQYPSLLNHTIGTKFKIVPGYPGNNDISVALERGEVSGRCGWSWSSVKSTRAAWLQEKKINILVQVSLSKHPDLPDVPLIMDLAKTDEQRQMFRLIFARQVMGRPFQSTPGVPADRLHVLQTAFMDTMKDPAFLAEADKQKFEITPVPGPAIEKLVTEILRMPPELAERAGSLLK